MVCDAVDIIDYCFFLMFAMTQSSMLFLMFLVNNFTQNVLSTVIIQYSSSEIFYKTPKKTRVLFSKITVCRLATLVKKHFVLLLSRKLVISSFVHDLCRFGFGLNGLVATVV